MALAQLVYVSRRTKALTQAMLQQVVSQSTAQNRERDISGVLMCFGNDIMQLLEGEMADITALFDRIRADPRHTNVHSLICKPIKKRMFPEWGMGMAALNSKQILNRERLLKLLDQVRENIDTSAYSVEGRILVNDFKAQLAMAA